MSVEIEGLDDIRAKLAALENLEFLEPEIEAIGVHLKGQVAIYPPQISRPQPFVSDRQRIGFFKRLREGTIQVPYRRGISPGSQALGRSWFSVREGFSAIVANRTGYGPLVQSDQFQTRYHKAGGWNTIEKVLETETPVILDRLTEAIDKQLGG